MIYTEPEFKYKPPKYLGIIIYAAIICAALMFLFGGYFLCYYLNAFGFRHYLSFFPSSSWTTISIITALVLGFSFSVPCYFTPALDQFSNVYKEIAVRAILTVAGFGFLFCGIFVYIVGPAVTHFSSATIEKTIAGTKIRESGASRSPCYYYIDTADLPEGAFAKLYITESEFDSIPNEVRMHVTLKQSFFGMTVESYSFILDHVYTK
jgi:hypothetical protein